jgi:two-component system phosphate regulon sensor histidine kinase PhoR
MDQNMFFWQHDPPFVWDEGSSLAKLLAALEPGIADSEPADLDAKQGSGDYAADLATEVTRRLTALFQEQVEYIAHLMDAPLCALYLAELEPVDKRRRTHRAGREQQLTAWQGRPSLWLRALFGAPWNKDVAQRGIAAPPGSPAMQALLDQEPLVDEGASILALSAWAEAHHVRQWLYIPLFGGRSLWPPARQGWPSSLRDGQANPTETQAVALGVLAVGRHTQAPGFTQADTRLLRVLGEKLVLELERVRLSEQAHQVYKLGQRYEALARRDAERERILDELGEGLLVVDPTGRILRMNAAGRELLGWPGLVSTSGDLGRLQDYEALQMRDVHDVPLLIDEWPIFRALRGQEFQHMEVRYFGPQGVERFLAFSGWPLRDEKGKVRQALLTFHEAGSEQKARAQLEQMVRLADQRAHYVGSVLEAMTDCVLVCNNAGVLLLVNAAGKRLLGMEQQRLFPERYALDQLVTEFFVRTPDGQPLSVEAFPLTRALRGETLHDVQLLMRTRGGGPDWQATISVSPIRERGEGARILGAVAVLVDVTQARELDRAKDEFLALAAHELKNPITSIRGFAQLLQRGGEQAPEGRERRASVQWVEKILNQTERLTQLVEEMTDAARADLGKLEVRQRPVALGALLRRVVEAQQVTTQRHKIQVEAPTSGLIVRGDERRLEQVFSNLVANAIKYSPAGGPITLTVQVLEPTPDEGALVEVTIQDQGQGIAPGDLERIFSRFTRAESVRRSRTQGLGLGLYIVRAIVEAHGGTIVAQSEGLGKGSTFIVRLPLAATKD